MIWLPVYDMETFETVYACGYECSACGYLATRKWSECPHCHEKSEDQLKEAKGELECN